MSWNPLLLVGAVIGVITALLIAAYVGVKDKKTSMGFERNMDDGEILRRLAGYARPYLGRFVLVGFLMLFSIAYDIVSPLIVGSIEELVVGEFELNTLFARKRKNVQGTFFVLEIIKMSTQIKKRLTIEKDMAILFSYVVNKINRIIMQKMHWRYLRIAGIT